MRPIPGHQAPRALLTAAVLAVLAAAGSRAQSAPAWADRSLAPLQRAERVVAAMTRDEKLGLVRGHFGMVLRRMRPCEIRIGGGYVPGVPRLGVPELFETDAGLGVGDSGSMRPGDVATAMPSMLATAASFDAALAYAGGELVAAQARAKGFNGLLGGCVNRTREEASVRGDEVFTAAEAAAKLRENLMLCLDEAVHDEDILNRLLQVCKANHGDCPVYLQVSAQTGEAAVIRCDLAVDTSARCLYGLADVIGMERVVCIGLRKKPIPWPELVARPVVAVPQAVRPALQPVGAGRG